MKRGLASLLSLMRWALHQAALRGLGVLVLALAAAQAQGAGGIRVVDGQGRSVTFAASPQRVVTLLPSLAESVCALGQCHRIVGVDRYTNWPASVQTLPKVGGGLDPNLEAIVALKPDVVLLTQGARVADKLEALGLKTLLLEPQTHAQTLHTLRTLATLFGLPRHRADSLWQTLHQQVAQAGKSLPPAARQARVYFEVGDGPYAAGSASFIGQTLQQMGLRNVVPVQLGVFPKLNPEFVLRAQPDVLMAGEGSASAMTTRPGWSQMAAVRAGRVCAFSSAQGDVLVRAGPRMGEAAQLIAQCMQRVYAPMPRAGH